MRAKYLLMWAALGLLWCVAGAWAQSRDAATAQSIATLKKQAAGGDAKAQFDLGYAYQVGQGVPIDKKNSVLWIRKSAEQGYALAEYALGTLYETGNLSESRDVTKEDFEMAALHYRSAAEKGNAGAQNDLGLLYERGLGVKQDDTQAAIWIRRAAEQGDSAAEVNLGELLLEGRGAPQDDREADTWFRKAEAADHGNSLMRWRIGTIYEASEHAANNYAQAAIWYRKAAEQGNFSAECNLGVLYDLGLGVPKDQEQADFWYRKGIDEKLLDRSEKLCKFDLQFYLGDGVPDDPTERATQREYAEEAASLRRDADQRFAYAQNKLGVLYDLGLGVPQDFGMAVSLYRKAAEQGFPPAQYKLGRSYVNGQGVPRDLAEAYFWFNLAAVGTPSTKEIQERAFKARNDAATKLKPEVLLQTQERARKWFEDHTAKP